MFLYVRWLLRSVHKSHFVIPEVVIGNPFCSIQANLDSRFRGNDDTIEGRPKLILAPYLLVWNTEISICCALCVVLEDGHAGLVHPRNDEFSAITLDAGFLD